MQVTEVTQNIEKHHNCRSFYCLLLCPLKLQQKPVISSGQIGRELEHSDNSLAKSTNGCNEAGRENCQSFEETRREERETNTKEKRGTKTACGYGK